jgi:hypothetical protein
MVEQTNRVMWWLVAVLAVLVRRGFWLQPVRVQHSHIDPARHRRVIVR